MGNFRVLPSYVIGDPSPAEFTRVKKGRIYFPRLVNPPASLPFDPITGRSFGFVFVPDDDNECGGGYDGESTDRPVSASDALGARALPRRFYYVDFARFYAPCDGNLLLLGGRETAPPVTARAAYLVRALGDNEKPPPWRLTYQRTGRGHAIPVQVPADAEPGVDCVPGAETVTALQPCAIRINYGGGVIVPINFSLANLGVDVSVIGALTVEPTRPVQLRFGLEM